jgi:hypothetical protein
MLTDPESTAVVPVPTTITSALLSSANAISARAGLPTSACVRQKTIEEALVVAGCLAGLGGLRHVHSLGFLGAVAASSLRG